MYFARRPRGISDCLFMNSVQIMLCHTSPNHRSNFWLVSFCLLRCGASCRLHNETLNQCVMAIHVLQRSRVRTRYYCFLFNFGIIFVVAGTLYKRYSVIIVPYLFSERRSNGPSREPEAIHTSIQWAVHHLPRVQTWCLIWCNATRPELHEGCHWIKEEGKRCQVQRCNRQTNHTLRS